MLSGNLSDVLTNTGIQSGAAIGAGAAAHAIGTATITSSIIGGLASAGIALAGTAIVMWLGNRKDNQMDKTNSSRIADEAERLLKTNLDAWEESNKTVEDRELALLNADAVISWMRGPQGCGNPALEDPGRRCISERLVEGARWPWLTWYVDPIKNYNSTLSVAATLAPGAASTGSSGPSANTPHPGIQPNPSGYGTGAAVPTGTGNEPVAPITGVIPPWMIGAAGLGLYMVMRRKAA